MSTRGTLRRPEVRQRLRGRAKRQPDLALRYRRRERDRFVPRLIVIPPEVALLGIVAAYLSWTGVVLYILKHQWGVNTGF